MICQGMPGGYNGLGLLHISVKNYGAAMEYFKDDALIHNYHEAIMNFCTLVHDGFGDAKDLGIAYERLEYLTVHRQSFDAEIMRRHLNRKYPMHKNDMQWQKPHSHKANYLAGI